MDDINLRELLRAIEGFVLAINAQPEGSDVLMPPHIWRQYEQILRLANIDKNIELDDE